MNYLWDFIIKAQKLEIPKKNIQFSKAKTYSPYMELSHENINFSKIENQIEINPYYRFYEIFKDLFPIDEKEDIELRNALFDILIHFLTNMDLHQGMNKREFYLQFILEDIEENVFGKSIKEKMKAFNRKEKNILLDQILKLYETKEALYLFKETMKKIFKKVMVYTSEEKDEILLFIGDERNEKNEEKLDLIKEFFMPIKFHLEIYWKNHFGILGVEETMKIDELALY